MIKEQSEAQIGITQNYDEFMSDPLRKASGEIDFGCWWYMSTCPIPEQWRVSWIRATGELYAVNLSSLHSLQPCIVIKVIGTEPEIEHYMKGWANNMILDARFPHIDWKQT